jgi:hypothetical protein
MRRLLPCVAVLLALSGVAQASAPTSTGLSAAARRPPVLATTSSGLGSSRLFLVDPVSLRPLAGKSLRLNFNWGDFARSPDGSLLALSRNDRAELRFVRLGNLRFAGAMKFLGQFVRPVAWFSPRLLLTVLDAPSPQAIAVDPTSRKVLWRRSIDGTLQTIERSTQGLVMLVAPGERIGPATLVTIGAGGEVRSVVLTHIFAGFERDQNSEDFVGRTRSPGLAVDLAGNQAYVVGAGEPIAQVDLAAMSVAYHGGSRTLAKAISGPERLATWLGNGMLAVAGIDSSVTTDAQGRLRQARTPSGLILIDTRTWAARLLQADAAAATVIGRSLLAYGTGYDSAGEITGSGLTIYTLDGTPRLHLLGQTPIWDVRAQGGLAYAFSAARDGRVLVVDAGAGRMLASVKKPDVALLLGR